MDNKCLVIPQYGCSVADLYNCERAHRGYRTQGRTPYQAFLEGLNLRPHREAA
jgi:hypothetical protein